MSTLANSPSSSRRDEVIVSLSSWHDYVIKTSKLRKASASRLLYHPIEFSLILYILRYDSTWHSPLPFVPPTATGIITPSLPQGRRPPHCWIPYIPTAMATDPSTPTATATIDPLPTPQRLRPLLFLFTLTATASLTATATDHLSPNGSGHYRSFLPNGYGYNCLCLPQRLRPQCCFRVAMS